MARFKTGYLQRMIPVDALVVGTTAIVKPSDVTSANRQAAIMPGDFVVFTPAVGTQGGSGYVPAYITKATTAQVTAKTATHLIAQADVTLAGNHIATDLQEYRYNPLVVAQLAAAPNTSTTIQTKKVALYPIFNWTDVVPAADGTDVSA